MRANVLADELLQSFNYPAAPIDVESIAKQLKYKVGYSELDGASGYTFRKLVKSKWRYVIYIATDMDSKKYTPLQIQYRQRYTLAHEIGHIVLHNHLDWNNVDKELNDILEVEANWFASRLLMPNYIFSSIHDMDPEILSFKCQVNYQAAQKRLNNLDKRVSSNLIRQATDTASLLAPTSIETIEYDFDLLKYYEEVAVTLENIDEDQNVICFICGNVNGSTEVLPLSCYNCGTPLFE